MPRINEGARGKVGPMSPSQYREMARRMNEPRKFELSGASNPVATFIARIKASPESIATNRWRYQWEEVVIKDDDSLLTTPSNNGGRKSKPSTVANYRYTWALNLCEMCQSVGGATKAGPGVTVANLPAGFSVQPVSENTCVVMQVFRRQSAQTLYVFSIPNAIDGACA